MTTYECNGCGQPAPGPGLCGWCRAAVIELSPLKSADTDELLATLREAVQQWADGTPTADGLFAAAFTELDHRATRGELPGDWLWPEADMEPPPPGRPVDTVRSDLL